MIMARRILVNDAINVSVGCAQVKLQESSLHLNVYLILQRLEQR